MSELKKDVITKEVMKQYEIIRKMGPCNMFDHNCVTTVAERMEFDALAELDRKDYVNILEHFSEYMKMYDIEQ